MNSDYQIWIEHDKGRDMLPMNPPEITVRAAGNNKSVNVIGLGEAVIPQLPKAKEISFSSFFPNHKVKGMSNPAMLRVLPAFKRVMPIYYVTLFMRLMKEKVVVRLSITGCSILMNCVVDDFKYSESGGDVGTIDYTVKFKEYVPVRMQKLNANSKKAVELNKTASRVVISPAVKTYTTRQGETLYTIGKKLYGDGDLGKAKLYAANRKIIGSNPNIALKVGLTLKVS